ncbi:MAG: N-acetyltransferase [Bryobacteraceae bacterium]
MSETPAPAIRKALLRDVGPLLKLINGYAQQGIMLPRTEFELAENVRDFTVAAVGDEVAGCGALHFYGQRSAEVRSLAVHPEWKGHGLGRRIVEALEAEARQHGIESLFAFTYIPDFFARLGFAEVDRRSLPSKVWKDCLRCPKLHCCDEIAMQKVLVAGFSPEEGLKSREADGERSNGFLIVPTVKPEALPR